MTEKLRLMHKKKVYPPKKVKKNEKSVLFPSEFLGFFYICRNKSGDLELL